MLFTIEFSVRLVVAETYFKPRPHSKELLFFKDVLNWFDFLAIIPFYARQVQNNYSRMNAPLDCIAVARVLILSVVCNFMTGRDDRLIIPGHFGSAAGGR